MGSKKLGLECLKQIYKSDPKKLIAIITIDDSNDLRSNYSEIQAFGLEYKIPVYTAKNRLDSEKMIRKIKPDLCLVVGWYWLLTKEILDFLPYGAIGLHASLLPKERGGAPLVWAMINGKEKAGVSLFAFDEGMDSGRIYGQEEVEIKPEDYISDVLEKVEKMSLKLIKKNYIQLLRGTPTFWEQDHKDATYCAQRNQAHGKIDWTKPAREVYNFIRAQSRPYPGAFSIFKEKKLIIWQARPLDMVYYGHPGQIVQIKPEGVYIVCGDQKPLLIQTVQLESGSDQKASEVIDSIKHQL